MSAFDEIAQLTFTPEKMTPLHWVIWNSRASLPSDLLEQAAEQLQRLTKRAPDARKSAPKKVSSNKKGSAKPARG